MNCERLPLLLNAALDDELTPADAIVLQRHLAQCPACREEFQEWQALDQDLKNALSAPVADPVVERVMRAISSGPPEKVHLASNASQRPPIPATRGSRLALLAVVSSLVVAAVFVLQISSATPAIAEIAMATGPIEFKPANAADWIAADGKSRVHLPANSRVRTQSNSLCEIHTRSDAVVRLNQETELVLRRPEVVELVAGELWCRAPETSSIKISGSAAASPIGRPSVFTCPSSTEMQWRTMPDQALTCVDVAAAPVTIQSNDASCTLQPGESVTFAGGKLSATAQHTDPLAATGWQLPLLALREPLDGELQQRLQQVLALVGRSKMAFLYEEQIRQLGPSGLLPLLAFVRSPESRENSELRVRAMSYAAEMATEAALPLFEALRHDDDPVIKKLANQAIARLQSR